MDMANYVFIHHQLVRKLEGLENEVIKLKKESILFSKKPISLKGILNGVKISTEEIEKSKKSLFRTISV